MVWGVGGWARDLVISEACVSVWGEKLLCVRGICETSLTYIKHTICMCYTQNKLLSNSITEHNGDTEPYGYFTKQREPLGFCEGDAVCFLLGRTEFQTFILFSFDLCRRSLLMFVRSVTSCLCPVSTKRLQNWGNFDS